MHMLVVTFELKGLSDADYRAGSAGLAPPFANIPGCLSKVWIADTGSNCYGGIYTFTDRRACETYRQSALFNGIATNPGLAHVTAHDFEVLDGPTRVTAPGLLAVAAE